MTAPENENGDAPAQDAAATASDASMVSGDEVVDRLRYELDDRAGIVHLKDRCIMAGTLLIEHESRVAAWDWSALLVLARTKVDEVRRQQGLGAAATAPHVVEDDNAWGQEVWDQSGNVRRTLRLTAGRLVWVPEDLAWYECDDSEIWRRTEVVNVNDVAAKWCARAMEVARRLEAAQYDDTPKKAAAGKEPDPKSSQRAKFMDFMSQSSKLEMHNAVAGLLRQRPEDYGIQIGKARFNAAPHELAVANGILDLRTGEVRPAKRDDYISIASTVEYDPEAQAPTFLRYLEAAHPEDDVREYLQKVLGYGITGEHRHHQMWIHHGEQGSEGKSLLFKVVEAVIGQHYGAANGKALVRQRSGAVLGQDMVDLGGRRLLALNETVEGAHLDDEAVKSITASDTRADRPHHKANVQHRITGKVHLVTNHLPHVTPDGGMRRRLNVVPWAVSFKDNPDEGLEDRILRELPGVLAWLVQGSMAWYADPNLAAPPSVALATMAYLGEEDEVDDWIEASCMRLDNSSDPKTWTTAANLYEDYVTWRFQTRRSGSPMSTTGWGRRLNGKGIPRREVRVGGRTYKMRPLKLNVSLAVPTGLES